VTQPCSCFATYSAVVSTRAADDCIARMMREPNPATLAFDAALLLSHGIGLLVPHGCARQPLAIAAIGCA